MKMTKDDFERLQQRIAPLDTEKNREAYRNGNFPRAELVKDLNKRFRWDLYWACRGRIVLKGEYTDAQIDTALRRIVPSL